MYEVEEELDLPDDKDFHILKDELIRLTSVKAKEIGIDKYVLRRVVVYDELNNRTIDNTSVKN